MQASSHSRDEILTTLLSVAFLSAMALGAPRFHAEESVTSFIGTSPVALNAEAQPATF